VTTRELNVLFSRLKKKYFKSLKTKLRIERTLKQEDTSCVAFYFAPLDTVWVYQWHLREATGDELRATLIHELVHAQYREKLDVLLKSPLVHSVECHDSDFMHTCYLIYKKEFSGKDLKKCMKNEYFMINYKEFDMKQALEYYGIKEKR